MDSAPALNQKTVRGQRLSSARLAVRCVIMCVIGIVHVCTYVHVCPCVNLYLCVHVHDCMCGQV
jgi:hypothetical protein